MKKIVFILFILVLLGSCKEPSQKETERIDGFTPVLKTKEDSLFHEVMEGHDIGMARMGKISKYLTKIKKTLDSLNRLPPGKVDTKYQQTLIHLQEDLNYAEYSMNAWMEGFKVDSAKEDKEKRVQYLEAEKLKVEKVKETILSSLQRADSIFIKK